MRNLVLLVILILNLLKSYAQEDTLFKKVQEVVITGQISKKTTEETVHKIRTISAKKINSGLFTNLGQVLEKELNFRLSEDIFLGSSISIQGVSGQNVKILIDDIPVIGRLDGNIDLSQISLNNIERIEIIEGPLSTIYGTVLKLSKTSPPTLCVGESKVIKCGLFFSNDLSSENKLSNSKSEILGASKT